MAATPAPHREPDAIIVGAGLSGLVAAAELVDAGKRVVIVEQEPEASLGGQAHWSFGGLFLIDSPEQRRMGVKDSLELAKQDWDGTRRVRPRRGRVGAPLGRRLPRVRRGREARVAAREGRPVLPDRRLGRTRRLQRHRPRQLGAALPHHVGHRAGRARARSSRRVQAGAAAGLVEFRHRHRVDELVVESGAVVGVRGAVLDAGCRGARRAEQPRRGRRLRAASAGGGRGIRRHRRQPRPRAGVLARAHGRPARGAALGRARPRRRSHAADRRARRRPPRQRRPHVALHRGHHELGPGVAEARHPHPPRPVVAVVRRDGRRLPVPLFPGFDTLGTLEHIVPTGHDALLVRAHAEDHREGVRALGQRAEPRPHRQGPEAARRAARLGRARSRRGVQAARRRLRGRRHPAPSCSRACARSPPTCRSTPRTSSARSWPATASSTTSSPRTLQLTAVRGARKYRGDKLIRVATPHRILDPKAGPLIAVKLHVLTRKSLGGIQTDLDSPGARARRLARPGPVRGRRGGRVRRRRRARLPRARGHLPRRMPLHRPRGRAGDRPRLTGGASRPARRRARP